MDPESLRAAFGWNGARYLKHFERMQQAGRTWLPGWNLAAFLHSTGWFWYRRMYGWSLLNLLAPVLLVAMLVFIIQWFLPDAVGLAFAVLGIAYLGAVFVLLPLFADSLYLARLRREGKPPRPPSLFTASGAFVLIAVPAAIVYASVQAQNDYARRARIGEGMMAAVALKAPIAEFHANERRLPDAREADRFRHREPLQHASSVGWDPARRAIVAVMGEREEGGRFEIVALQKDGALEWVCRTIDLDPKYLPASCR